MRRMRLGMGTAMLAAAMLALASVPAQAQDGAVAQVLTATSRAGVTEVQLRVVKGMFLNNDTVDLLRPGAKTTATLALLGSVDMAMAGDTLKATLKTSAPFDITGAIVAERGRFADHAAASRLSGASAAPAAPAPALAAAPAGPARVQACAFAPAELMAALGLDLKAGTDEPALRFAGGQSLGCRYDGGSLTAPFLHVSVILMDDPKQATGDGYFKTMAGTMEPVPNDPHKAMWQGGQGDMTGAVLHYVHQGAIVELRVNVRPTHPRFQAIKTGLVRLRRLP